MASVSWSNTGSGNWDTKSNWSTGLLPGSADDVTINTSAAATITHSSSASDTISTLYLGTVDTLAITGGTLDILGTASLYGSLTESAGTLVLGPDSFSNEGFTQTGGTLRLASGITTIEGSSNSFAGTITGSAIDFANGTTTLAAGATLSVGHVGLSGGTLTLAETITYAGAFTATGGTFSLGADKFTTAAAGITNTFITGSAGSTLALSGLSTLSNDYLAGTAVLSNTGTIVENGYLFIGYNSTDTAQFINTAGATFRLAGSATLYGTTGSLLTNAGLLVKTGLGNTTINTSISSTGTVEVASGQLTFNGASNFFGGTISGAGVADFAAGTDTFQSGLVLTVSEVNITGATVVDGANFNYGGRVIESSGTLSLNGHTLTLTGSTAFDSSSNIQGSGTLSLSGTTEIANTYFDDSGTLINTGNITQTGYFFDGSNSTDTNVIENMVGATYTLVSGNTLYGYSLSSFTNAGLFTLAGDQGGNIQVSFSNTGSLVIDAGNLNLQGVTNSIGGNVTGGGELELSSGSTTIARGATITTQGLLVNGGTTTLAENLKYSGVFTQTSGSLDLGGYTLTLTDGNLLGGSQSGSGTVTLMGTGSLAADLIEGSVVLVNNGTTVLNSYLYVGYNSTDTAQLINQAHATLYMFDGAEIYGVIGAKITNAGSLIKFNGTGTSFVNDSFTSTGTVETFAGDIQFNGATNSFSGVISGAGYIDFTAGSSTIAATTRLTVKQINLSGGTLQFTGNVAYAGFLAQSAGDLLLSGQTVTLTGNSSFEGGVISGVGTIAASGAVNDNNLSLSGSVVFNNAGTLTDTNIVYVGTQSSDTAALNNLSTGTIILQESAQIYTSGAGNFSNAGTLIANSGLAPYISANFTNTGSISILQGDLQIRGAIDTIGGIITGGGTLELNGGAISLAPASLTVSSLLLDGAAVTLGANLSYAGLYTQTANSLNLNGHKLTLTGGATSLQGGVIGGIGSMALTGTSEVGNFAFNGSAAITNSGSLTVENGGVLYVGNSSSDTTAFTNASGAQLLLLGSSQIYTSGAGTLTNAGTLLSEGASGNSVTVTTINTGTINVGQGALTFIDGVSGTGGFTMGAGTDLVFSASASGGGTVTMGLDSTLALSTGAGFSDIIGNFAAGNLIDLNGFGYNTTTPPTLAFNSGTDKLTVTSGSSTFILAFTGAHTAADFVAVNDRGTIGIAHT